MISLPPVILNHSRCLTEETPRGHPSRPDPPEHSRPASLRLHGAGPLPHAASEGADMRRARARARDHVTPSRHGGGAERPRVAAYSGLPVLLHGGPGLRALPDAGGAGAAGGHGGE